MELLTTITLLSNMSFYEESLFVKPLKPVDIYKLSREANDELHLIQYYSGKATNSSNISKILETSAMAMSGYVKVGAINLDKYPLASYVNHFASLPTYAFYGYYKGFPEYFNKLTFVDQINEEATKQISIIFDEKSVNRYVDSRENYELGYLDLEVKVNNSTKDWCIVYYDVECQNSKDFSKTWNKLVEELNLKYRFGSINNRVYKVIETNIYPVIKFFPRGTEFLHEAVAYDGISLEYEHVYKFLYDKIRTPKLSQIVNVNNVTPCFKRKFCVGVFMPKIIDCDGYCRNNSLQILKQACEKFKQYSLYCVWSQFDEQPELQSLFNIKSSNKPVVVILNVQSEHYTNIILNETLSLDKIEEMFESIKYEGFRDELIIEDIPKVLNISESWSFDGIAVNDEL